MTVKQCGIQRQKQTLPIDVDEGRFETPKDFIYSSVAIKSEAEYNFVLGVYMTLGARPWFMHRGYQPITKADEAEGVKYHVYGWETCGFLKHSGCISSYKPTFKTPNDFVIEACRVLGTDK